MKTGRLKEYDSVCKKLQKKGLEMDCDVALEKIQELEQKNIDNIPICVSKTQYSLSDDKNMLGYPKDNILHVKDIKLCNGARFITIMLGNILTMPGLPKNPNYEKIDLDQNNNIIGLF